MMIPRDLDFGTRLMSVPFKVVLNPETAKTKLSSFQGNRALCEGEVWPKLDPLHLDFKKW